MCYCPGENERLKRNEIGTTQSGKAGESPVLITAVETGSVCHILHCHRQRQNTHTLSQTQSLESQNL